MDPFPLDPPDDEDLKQRLSPLADLLPDPARTQGVLRTARRTAARRTTARWALAAVAVVAVSVTLAYLSIAGPASAAEALTTAARASAHYPGWVHIRDTNDRGPGFRVQHFDSRSGTWAAETHEPDGHWRLHMYDPVTLAAYDYDSATRQLKVGRIERSFATGWADAVRGEPLTIDEMMKQMPGATVRQGADGPLTRFDLTLPPDDPKRAAAEDRGVRPTAMIVWVDPATGLIRKSTTVIDGRNEGSDITYGGPAIATVYDVGVPRDATVVDLRPPRGVDDLMARLHRHFEAGLGDYVAVKTTSSPDGSPSRLELFAEAGSRALHDGFAVDRRNRDRQGYLKLSALPGWPTLSVDAALAAAAGRVPGDVVILAGGHAWQGYGLPNRPIESTDRGRERPEMASIYRGRDTLPGELWPVFNLYMSDTDAKTELMADPNRPGLVGLKIDRLYFMHAPNDTRLVQRYWFDPAKDDLVADRDEVYTAVKTGRVVESNHERVTRFTRTADGRWYPAHVEYRQSMASADGTHPSTWSSVADLTVATGRTLGPEWFTEPTARPTTRP